MPVRFDAPDVRADNATRQVELHRERVILRRAVGGMRMAVSVRVCDFLGVALRGLDEARALVLVHRDPALSIPLGSSADADELIDAWQAWCSIFGLPQLVETPQRDAAPRRRRRNAIGTRRPKFLVRRRMGETRDVQRHTGEREIIARD